MSTIVFTFQIPYYFVKRCCFFLKKKLLKGFSNSAKGDPYIMIILAICVFLIRN